MNGVGLVVAAGIAIVSLAGSASAASVPEPLPRIIGGERTSAAEQPWMVALVGRDGDAFETHFCGGSLIAPDWVLTAAHCVEDAIADELDVLVGVTDLTEPDAGERIGVIGVFVHPSWRAAFALGEVVDGTADDLALLRLERPSTGTPITLARGDQRRAFPSGTPVLTSGWGNRSTTDNVFSPELYAAELTVSDEAACDAVYEERLARRYVCATSPGGRRDSCQGDSGGPLRALVDGEPVLVGVVAFGEECGSATHPGVYSRVSAYAGYIAETRASRYAIDTRARFEPALTPSAARAVVPVHNLSTEASIEVSGARFEDGRELAVTSDGCSERALAPGERCELVLSWSPAAPGEFADALLVEVFDGVSNDTRRVALDGVAYAPFLLADALDLPGTDVFDDQEAVWRLVEDDVLEGDTAIRTDSLFDIPTVARLVASVPEGGTFGFGHRGENVSIRLIVDGVEAASFESEAAWRRESIELDGPARVTFELFGADFPSVFELDGLSLVPADPSGEGAGEGGDAGNDAGVDGSMATNGTSRRSGGGAASWLALLLLGPMAIGRRARRGVR